MSEAVPPHRVMVSLDNKTESNKLFTRGQMPQVVRSEGLFQVTFVDCLFRIEASIEVLKKTGRIRAEFGPSLVQNWLLFLANSWRIECKEN